MCSTLAHRPELEQRAGAGCGGGSQGRGLILGLGALLLKAKVQVSKTQPHPAGAKAAGAGGGRVTGEGPPGRQAAGPSLPLQKGEGVLSTGATASAGRGLMASHRCRGRGPGDSPSSPPGGPRPCTPAALSLTSPQAPSLLPRSSTPKMKVKVAQSRLTLCDPVDYTVHGILQAGILEWEAFPFSRGSSEPRSPALRLESLPAEPPG